MKSSSNEPKGIFDGFDIWDYLAVWVCADFGSAGIILLLTGGGVTFQLAVAVGLWALHESSVRMQVADGDR